MDTIQNDLRLAAYAADDAYQTELVRVYGPKRAGDMRYQPKAFSDAALIAARDAKVAADAAWHTARHAEQLRRTRLGLDDYA
jgi:hypothetical protein